MQTGKIQTRRHSDGNVQQPPTPILIDRDRRFDQLQIPIVEKLSRIDHGQALWDAARIHRPAKLWPQTGPKIPELRRRESRSRPLSGKIGNTFRECHARPGRTEKSSSPDYRPASRINPNRPIPRRLLNGLKERTLHKNRQPPSRIISGTIKQIAEHHAGIVGTARTRSRPAKPFEPANEHRT
jgi:hypothetical protein